MIKENLLKEIVRVMELILFGREIILFNKPEFWQIFGVDVIALFGPGPKSYAIFEGNEG